MPSFYSRQNLGPEKINDFSRIIWPISGQGSFRVHSFIHKYFLRAYYVLGTVLGAGVRMMAKTAPDFLEFTSWWRRWPIRT